LWRGRGRELWYFQTRPRSGETNGEKISRRGESQKIVVLITSYPPVQLKKQRATLPQEIEHVHGLETEESPICSQLSNQAGTDKPPRSEESRNKERQTGSAQIDLPNAAITTDTHTHTHTHTRMMVIYRVRMIEYPGIEYMQGLVLWYEGARLKPPVV